MTFLIMLAVIMAVLNTILGIDALRHKWYGWTAVLWGTVILLVVLLVV